MKILVIGTGYVGTTTGLVFAELGHRVTGLDLDPKKIDMLHQGKSHFYEPGVDEMLKKHVKSEKLFFTTDKESAIRENDIIFICVGTPSREDGSADLSYVKQVAEDIGRYMNRYKIVINKSTVPVKTSEKVKKWIGEAQLMDCDVDVISNPEFLREGSALKDGLHPERIIIGSNSKTATSILKELYKRIDSPIIVTSPRTAEMIKYASNSFLAMKISFINEIARLCDQLEVNVKDVAYGMGLDSRVGRNFIQAGIGYGGSCFPKDVKALMHTGREHGIDLTILERVMRVNDSQPFYFADQVKANLRELKNKNVAVFGITFKAHTDDLRETRSFPIIKKLTEEKACVRVHDPIASLPPDFGWKGVQQYNNPYDAIEGADAVIICTEWPQYGELDWKLIKGKMRTPYLFDGKNMLPAAVMKELGFYYQGIGYR